jgi:anaerobic ribonucleoside-triphosphate reductase activating protein
MNNIYVTLQSSINSDGLWYPSISIYYSGCDKPIKCKDCHNPELQQCNNGFATTSDKLIQDIETILKDWLNTYNQMSLCFLGGEPLAEWNRESVQKVSEYFKEHYPTQIYNVVYSWRYIEDLQQLKQYIKYMDYGVLGDFQIENRDVSYIPSSSNQYIYDFNNNIKLPHIKKG